MSSFFFRTNINSQQKQAEAKAFLETLQNNQDIDGWQLDVNHPEHILQIETVQFSSETLKHALNEAGIDAEFTTAPQAR
ncbi:MAG: hypothetical protein ABR502_12420 [Chitinophagaceae bacterium]